MRLAGLQWGLAIQMPQYETWTKYHINKRLILLLIMNDQYQNSYKQVLTHIA